MKSLNKIVLFSSALLLLGLGACKKSYLDRLPSDEAPLSDVFKTTDAAEAALQGLHRMMYEIPSGRQDDEFGQKSIDLMNDLMGDDMTLTDQGAGWFVSLYNYTASRNADPPGDYPWHYYFQMINNANEILSHIDAADGPQSVKDNITGQTLFYRAFAYYNLSIYYMHTYAIPDSLGGTSLPCVPIYTEPTREGNARATIKQVYDFINSDLTESRSLLTAAREDKSEINIDVVNGLSARVALVMQDWQKAAEYARAARQNYPYMTPGELLGGFNQMNGAWIWGSKLVEDQTSNVQSFISEMDIDAGGYAALGQQKHINTQLYGVINEDTILYIDTNANDIRKQWWYGPGGLGSYEPYSQTKFKVKVVGLFGLDQCYMRAAEMALIEAEADAHMNKLTEAADILGDLMKIRDPNYIPPATTGPNAQILMLYNILVQRRIELWGEGFRFSDIQRVAPFAFLDADVLPTILPPIGAFQYQKGLHRERTGASPVVMGEAKTITDPYDNRFLFRIPGAEIQNNNKIVQNP